MRAVDVDLGHRGRIGAPPRAILVGAVVEFELAPGGTSGVIRRQRLGQPAAAARRAGLRVRRDGRRVAPRGVRLPGLDLE